MIKPRTAIRLAALALVALSVSGCCIPPPWGGYGHEHHRGYGYSDEGRRFNGEGWRSPAPAPSRDAGRDGGWGGRSSH